MGRIMTVTTDAHLLRLLTWLSPAFPVGAFGYSHGLETVIREGVVQDAQTLSAWVAGLIEQDRRAVDVTEEAYWRFNDELDRVESRMIYMDRRVSNYYRNEHGRSSVNGLMGLCVIR